MNRSWDIFCSVVDNFGDIGVCWRLSRQLASELDQSVRLWVDDLASFRRLCPRVDPTLVSQSIEGVDVRQWTDPFPEIEPSEIVIEGFGVRAPDSCLARMAARQPKPAWINLEYLSAEDWVEGCHGVASPHPRLPLLQYFFFPGFTAKTGGLLIEQGLEPRRDAFQRDGEAQSAFWGSLGVPAHIEAMRISLFCYSNPALPLLVDAWSRGGAAVACFVPEGAALTQLGGMLGRHLAPGATAKLGALEVYALPFLEMDQYDRLLWACDLNFVRGEDSFVRAQVAARPLVWQAYPQAQDAHTAKVEAFIERYGAVLKAEEAQAISDMHRAWNGEACNVVAAWQRWSACQTALASQARAWAGKLARGPRLAVKLAEFCENRLK